jgi:hypothetical protein
MFGMVVIAVRMLKLLAADSFVNDSIEPGFKIGGGVIMRRSSGDESFGGIV